MVTSFYNSAAAAVGDVSTSLSMHLSEEQKNKKGFPFALGALQAHSHVVRVWSVFAFFCVLFICTLFPAFHSAGWARIVVCLDTRVRWSPVANVLSIFCTRYGGRWAHNEETKWKRNIKSHRRFPGKGRHTIRNRTSSAAAAAVHC